MRTKDGRELANALNIIFVELPKAKGLEDSLETNTALENWAIFLKDADNPKKADVIRKLTDKEAGLMNAQKSLSSISANRDLWIAQYHQELHERDRISGLEAAHNNGVRDGKIQSAKNALSMGLSPAQVSKITGLSEEEIRKLQ